MREPRRISVPAPLTVNSSRSSCSGLTTVTLRRCGTDSTTRLTWLEQHGLPARQRARRQQPLRIGRQADHRQHRPAVRREARHAGSGTRSCASPAHRRATPAGRSASSCSSASVVASSDTSGIAPRATMARIVARVSAPIGRRRPWRERPRTARRPRATTRTRASPARRRPWARAGRAPPPAAGPDPRGCAGRSAADRARSSRSGRWAPASRSSPCAARGAGAGTDRCRPWRRRFRESAGRFLLPSPQDVREGGAGRPRARRSRRTRRRRGPARRRPGRTRPRRSRARTAATPRSSTPRSIVSAMRAPSSGSKPARCRAACSDGWLVVTDQAIACGDVAARTRRSASASRSSTRSPGAGAAKTTASRASGRR